MSDGNIDSDNNRRDEGGDVGRNPDAIQREIEQTRAELADTIDAIADRISPKRAASRSASAVKAQVSSVLGHSNGHSAPSVVVDKPAAPTYTETTSYQVNRQLRVDRVLVAVGAVAALAGGIVLWRSRRR